MPKLIIDTKFSQEEEIYVLWEGYITKGIIRDITIAKISPESLICPSCGVNHECSHTWKDPRYDADGHIIQYGIVLIHPAIPENSRPKMYPEMDVYRSPAHLIQDLRNLFTKTYADGAQD